MPTNRREAKADELLGQLNREKLAAVVHLLEVVVDHNRSEPATSEDRRRVHEGQEWLAQHGGKGIPMDEDLSDFGLTVEDFPLSNK